MLEKTAQNERDVQVTFRMPPMDGVVELYLCGEFNNWHTAGAPLSLETDGSWVATLVLQAGKSYRFRYLDNQGRWHNDWDADAYVPNDFGTEDSVVDLIAPLKKYPQGDVKQAKPRVKGAPAGRGDSAGKRASAGKAPLKGAAAGKLTASGKGTPAGKNAPPKKGRPRPR